ncbi:MAG TPA: hypothetical protein DGN60_04415 [Chloroflexi bacterium]|mgnify:CR=1 FL=1|nr:hypothetical protein [Chloroflexota bacterium]|tara:strand:- start:500 stop:1681 length:1182 start_codon:yes stop_codon:yes gene_type:complete
MGDPHYDICMLVENSFQYDSRILREARSLSKNGFELLLLALYEPHITEREEKPFGFQVRRINVLSRRIRTRWLLGIKVAEFILKLLIYAIRSKASIFHAHHPVTLLPAAIAAKLLGAKLIYDSHELATALPGNSQYKNMIIKFYEGMLLKIVDRVIMSDGESRAKIFRQTHSFNGPIDYIYNCPVYVDTTKRNKDLRKPLSIDKSSPIICFTGHVGEFSGIDKVVPSMTYWPENTHFVMVGQQDFIYLEPILYEAGILSLEKRIHSYGPVPADDVANWLSSADIAIIPIENAGSSYYYSAPTKMFEAIMAGIPQVSSNFPEIRRVVMGNDIGPVGKLINPRDEKEIGTTISGILADKSEYKKYQGNAELLAKNVCKWEVEEKKLLSLYDNLIH